MPLTADDLAAMHIAAMQPGHVVVGRDVGGGVGHGAPVGTGDLPPEEERGVELSGLVGAEVEQVEQGVLPPAPGREPVDRQQPAGAQVGLA